MKTTTGKKTTTKKKIINYCAAVGAVYGCMSVTDAVIIVHGPRSCAHIMYTLKVIAEIKRGHGTDFRSSNVHSTEMDDTISVFGGAGSLEQKIRDLILEGHKSFFIVTTCASGIIGEIGRAHV